MIVCLSVVAVSGSERDKTATNPTTLGVRCVLLLDPRGGHWQYCTSGTACCMPGWGLPGFKLLAVWHLLLVHWQTLYPAWQGHPTFKCLNCRSSEQ